MLIDTANYNADGIAEYSICESLLRGSNPRKKEDYDLMTVYLLYLSNQSGEGSEGIIRLLSVLLSETVSREEKLTILKEEFEISPTKALNTEVTDMGSLADGIEMRALERGRSEGIEKGIEKGMRAMIESFVEISVPKETIIEKIAEKFDLSREDAEETVKKYSA